MKEVKAHADVSTGKIYGCKKGSWKWWHEKGHLVFNDEKSFVLMIRTYLFDLWMATILFAFKYQIGFTLAVIFWFGYFIIGIYEEWWCNQYANKRFKYPK